MTDQNPRARPRPVRQSAIAVLDSGHACCAPGEGIGAELYSALERDELPDAAVLASLGCGNPTAVADLHEGERVLDLGSGGGIDVLLSAKRVGPTGRVFGLDMTDEMLALAPRNIAEAGATNVELLKGHIEAIPLPADSIDVVISNCVVNLAADKPAVFREIARVLRPGWSGGHHRHRRRRRPDARSSAPSAAATSAASRAPSRSREFEAGLREVGLLDVSVTPTHAVAEGMHSAIVKATKSRDVVVPTATPVAAVDRVTPGGEAGFCGGAACC